jgi:hypothetical protein
MIEINYFLHYKVDLWSFSIEFFFASCRKNSARSQNLNSNFRPWWFKSIIDFIDSHCRFFFYNIFIVAYNLYIDSHYRFFSIIIMNIIDIVTIFRNLRFWKGDFWHFQDIFGGKVYSKNGYQQRALQNL